MMEKYGAEVKRYEVVKPIPGTPDDFKQIATNLTQDEALEEASKHSDAIIRPV